MDLKDLQKRLQSSYTKFEGGLSFDPNLIIKLSTAFYHTELFKFVKNKAREVQLGTSKKVIKQFHKNVTFETSYTQTVSSHDAVIHELEDIMKELRDKLNRVTKDYANECRNHEMSKRQLQIAQNI